MYRQLKDHIRIGYPYTEHLPLLDPTEITQPNILSECLTTTYSGGYDTLCGSDSSSYVSPSLLQRRVSSKSLEKNTNAYNNGWFNKMGLVPESESESNLVRRVSSTDDLQKTYAVQCFSRSESPLSSESNSIIESMTRSYPYSPEEKKERIERYRSKRSLRNFTKKIKYECRKTLADSRPRVRGRFAKNDEIDNSSQSSQWSQECVEEDGEDNDNWLIFIDSFSANLLP